MTTSTKPKPQNLRQIELSEESYCRIRARCRWEEDRMVRFLERVIIRSINRAERRARDSIP